MISPIDSLQTTKQSFMDVEIVHLQNMICHIQRMSGFMTILQAKQMTNDRHIKLQFSIVEI